MTQLKIDPSSDDFESHRVEGLFYIDKTEMIYDYFKKHYSKRILFTRPRRFGKTMIMTMFRDFLDIRQDSRKLFEGLDIMKHPETVEEHMNKHPVIFLSLKEVKGNNWEEAQDELRTTLAALFETFHELRESKKISDSERLRYIKVCDQEINLANIKTALKSLSTMLYKHYGKNVFVIVDEYDVPMANAYGKPCYNQVVDMVQSMLSNVGKTNKEVAALIMSGCLHTVMNSGYTGFNNIIAYGILSYAYSSYFGFCEEDVSKILAATGIEEKAAVLKEWYNGYIFGETHIYNPWDVMKYVNEISNDERRRKEPGKYWINTSESRLDLIQGFIGRTPDALEYFGKLLSGEAIEKKINEDLPYHMLHASGDNLWTGLLETGYLTKATEEDGDILPLRIPNKEIIEVFRQEVWNFFNTNVKNVFLEEFMNALWQDNVEGVTDTLNQIMEAVISSYQAYKEYVYQYTLVGLFTGMGLRVRTEYESGYGRSDVVVEDAPKKRALVLELKQVEKEGKLDDGLAEACDQTLTNKYESSLVYDGYTEIHKYGMSFWNKRCIIKAM